MWCDDPGNLATLARWLGEQALTNGWEYDDWAYFMEKGHKWTAEWNDMQAAVVESLGDPAANTVGPFQSHSQTSKDAALHNQPRSGTQRRNILDFLVGQGDTGATRQEIAGCLGMSDDSVRPRIVELMKGGWVQASAFTRPTPLGEQAEVVVATVQARQEPALRVESARQDVSPSPVADGPLDHLFDPREGAVSVSHYESEAA